MTTFDKREEAFERRFVHDEGVRFKALNERCFFHHLKSSDFGKFRNVCRQVHEVPTCKTN